MLSKRKNVFFYSCCNIPKHDFEEKASINGIMAKADILTGIRAQSVQQSQ